MKIIRDDGNLHQLLNEISLQRNANCPQVVQIFATFYYKDKDGQNKLFVCRCRPSPSVDRHAVRRSRQSRLPPRHSGRLP